MSLSRQAHFRLLAALLMAGIVAIDTHYPTGYAVSLLYVGVILLGLWAPGGRLAIEVGAAGTLLTVVGHALSARGGEPEMAYFNLSVSILVLWVTALGVSRYRRSLTAHSGTEAALRQSGKELEDIKYALDQSAIVATTDVRGDITYVNHKFCEISKYGRDELMGRNHRILNSGLHPLDFFQQMYATIGRGRVWRGEIRNRAKDGALYWVDTTIVPFVDDRGRPYQYIAIRYDITERKASEAALREQEALAQLGKMAAVVAHEVRNPLAGIRGALQVIGRRLGENSREHAIANEIISRIDTLNNIVQDLLVFARPRQPVLANVPVAGLIHEIVTLLREDPTLAELEIQVETGQAAISADREQIKLALLNLLMNGAQAMRGQGRVGVSTRQVDGTVEIRIVDHGPGIPAAVREHLFEPFFTTKHRGTGLGLATARRIFEAHHGTVELECPPDGGTVAVVRLPKGEPVQSPLP